MVSNMVSYAILLAVLINGAKPWAINLFAGVDYKELSIGVAGQEEECVNIPRFFQAKSIDPRDFCVNLYESDDCKGTKYAFFRSSTNNNNLELITKARFASAKSCNTEY